MTGNSGNNKLLAILGTYKPAPWRGRYSLSRLFFNFYLLVMGSFVAIAIFADFVISTAVKESPMITPAVSCAARCC